MLKSQTRTTCAFILLLGFACMLRLDASHAGEGPCAAEQPARKPCADLVRQSYHFAFTRDGISLPANAAVDGAKPFVAEE